MKAAIYKEKQRLAVEEIPDPRPEDDEVVMRVKYCAICGSDLHRYALGMMSLGTIMGHEYAGEIVEVGRNVKQWKVGDRACPCGGPLNPGREFLNHPPRFTAKERGFLPGKPGAYAQYLTRNADQLMKIPEGVSDLDASLLEPLTVAVHMLRVSKIRLGDSAVVLGAGPIGLFAQQCAALAGAGRVFVSEVIPARIRAARELGASKVFDPSRVDLVQEIVRETGIGADIAFECAGARPTLQQALELVRMGGRVMVVAMAWEPVDLVPVDWIGREVEMKTCYDYLNSEWPISMELFQKKKIQTGPMVSQIVPLTEIQQTFQDLLQPRHEMIQVVVDCHS